MLKNIKIATKLMGISVASLFGLIMLSGVGIKGNLTGIDALKTIYEKNVVPRDEVNHARERFDTILNDLIHVTSEFLPTGQAKDRIYTLKKDINSFFKKAATEDFYDDPYLKKILMKHMLNIQKRYSLCLMLSMKHMFKMTSQI